MEEKKEIENYLKNMFEFYDKNNYKFFVEKCLSFNVKIGDYNKNINALSKKVYDTLLNLVSNIECKYTEYSENPYYYYLKVEYSKNNSLINKIIVDVPLFEESYEYIAKLIFNYLNENKINFNMKFYKLLKNSFFKLEFFTFDDFKKFSEFFNMNSEINSVVKSRVIPFLNKSYYLGVYTEVSPYSFKNFYIKNLYMYFSYYKNNSSEDGVTLSGFLNYITGKYRSCKNINEKRMYLILLNYIEISNDSKELSSLFDTNTVMSIGSYISNDFILKIDSNKMIYFVSKDNDEEIKYGSEDFLNIAYSKYYDNVIKQEKNNKYFYSFFTIYDEILSSQYKKIDNIFSLLNEKMDIINRLLLVFSSAFFAYKKMNFPINIVYSILDNVVSRIYDYNDFSVDKEENKKIETNKQIVSKEYVLSEELANKLIDLHDGKKVAFKDYINKYDILSNIKIDTIIHLKDGRVLSGKEFIDDLYKYISFYKSFSELLDDMVSMIEYK